MRLSLRPLAFAFLLAGAAGSASAAVREQHGLKAPVGSAVREVPALPQLLDSEADGVIADTHR